MTPPWTADASSWRAVGSLTTGPHWPGWRADAAWVFTVLFEPPPDARRATIRATTARTAMGTATSHGRRRPRSGPDGGGGVGGVGGVGGTRGAACVSGTGVAAT